MEYITFAQFIYTINIRSCYTSALTGKEVDDGAVLRVHYGRDFDECNYIDISWCDYSRKNDVWENLEKYLKKEILESIVTDLYFNRDLCCMEIYTCAKENVEESLEEYKN